MMQNYSYNEIHAMAKKYDGNRFKHYYSFMNDILDNMKINDVVNIDYFNKKYEIIENSNV